jgi:hypothetical protein
MLSVAAMLCPRGNGRDTLRVWESLYLGRLVVTLRGSTIEPLYDGLPVLLLDDWAQLFEVERVRNATLAFARRARELDAERLFAPHWLCSVGRAAGREREFCTEQGLIELFGSEGRAGAAWAGRVRD